MKKFNSYQEYIDLSKQVQSKGFKNINCYLMPDEIIDLINKNKLFYLISEDTFEIIIKNDRLYKVSFYASEFNFIPFENDVPIVVDIPYNNKMNEKMIEFREKLKNQGFYLNSSTSRMSCSDFDGSEILFKEYTIKEISSCDIDDVYNIWEENFDKVENLLYSKDEIKSNKNLIFVVKDKKENVLAAMELIINGRYGWVQKIAVKKTEQGKGIGGILERFYINRCKMLGIKTLLLYTIDSNLNAQNFHKRFGFKPDGKFNCQFVYKK